MEGNKGKGSSVFKGLEPNGCAASRGSQAADAFLMPPFKVGTLGGCGGAQVGRLAKEAELKAEPRAPSVFGATCRETKAKFVGDGSVFGPLCF